MRSNLYITFATLIFLVTTAHSSSPQNSDNDLDDIFKGNSVDLEHLHSDDEDADNETTFSSSYTKSDPRRIAKIKDDETKPSSLPFIGSPSKAERAASAVLSSLEKKGSVPGRTSPFKPEMLMRKNSITSKLDESKTKSSTPPAVTTKYVASIMKKSQNSFSDPDINSLRKKSPSPEAQPFSPHLDILLPILQQIITRDQLIFQYTYLVLHKTNRGNYPGNLNPELIPEVIRNKSLPELLTNLAQQLKDREQDNTCQLAQMTIQDCLQSIKK